MVSFWSLDRSRHHWTQTAFNSSVCWCRCLWVSGGKQPIACVSIYIIVLAWVDSIRSRWERKKMICITIYIWIIVHTIKMKQSPVIAGHVFICKMNGYLNTFNNDIDIVFIALSCGRNTEFGIVCIVQLGVFMPNKSICCCRWSIEWTPSVTTCEQTYFMSLLISFFFSSLLNAKFEFDLLLCLLNYEKFVILFYCIRSLCGPVYSAGLMSANDESHTIHAGFYVVCVCA